MRYSKAIVFAALILTACSSRDGGGTVASGGGAGAPGSGGSGGQGGSTTCIESPPTACAADTDCSNGYRCNKSMSPPTCFRLYCAGVGEDCTSADQLCETDLICNHAHFPWTCSTTIAGEGQSCSSIKDAGVQCSAGLICDMGGSSCPTAGTCQPRGTVAAGDACQCYSDCQKGSICSGSKCGCPPPMTCQ